jgi:hypothetical protein
MRARRFCRALFGERDGMGGGYRSKEEITGVRRLQEEEITGGERMMRE